MAALANIATTKTTDFILPLLGRMKQWYGPWLINAYLGDCNVKSPVKNSIYVLMKYSGKNSYAEKETAILEHPNYIDSYDVYAGEFVMYIFELPEDLLEDYTLIMKGKYSEISDESKQLLLMGRGVKSPMPYILRKDKTLKDYWEDKLDVRLPEGQEVWSIIDVEEEIFDIVDLPFEPSVL